MTVTQSKGAINLSCGCWQSQTRTILSCHSLSASVALPDWRLGFTSGLEVEENKGKSKVNLVASHFPPSTYYSVFSPTPTTFRNSYCLCSHCELCSRFLCLETRKSFLLAAPVVSNQILCNGPFRNIPTTLTQE